MLSSVSDTGSSSSIRSAHFGQKEKRSASSISMDSSVDMSNASSGTSISGASMHSMLTDAELRYVFETMFCHQASDNNRLAVPVPKYMKKQLCQSASFPTKCVKENNQTPLQPETKTKLRRLRSITQIKNRSESVIGSKSGAPPSYWISFSYMRSNRPSIDMRVRQSGVLQDLAMSPLFSKLTLKISIYPSPNRVVKRTVTLKKSASDQSFRTSFTTFPLSMDSAANTYDAPVRVRYRVIVHRWLVMREVVAQWTDNLKGSGDEEITTQWHRVDFNGTNRLN